jgi:acyl-CoA reductase-like NAD-dependent aldehyde dehydrogenase
MSVNPAFQLRMFIDQREIASSEQFEVRDPGRLSELVGIVHAGDAGHVLQAVEAANRAFQTWRQVRVRERVERVVAAANAMQQHAAELAVLLVREQGMLLRDTQRDVNNGIRSLKEMAELAEPFLKPQQYDDGESLVRIEKAPRGVVAAIVPWNAPMGLTMGKVGPALAAGNTLVVKPSPHAPLAVSRALQLIADFFPPGTINVVHGDAEVGPALTRHPLVRMVSFTGGTRTGKAVMAAAADSVKNVALELGGNDAAIVLDDIEPQAVVPELVKGIFPRSGQVCYAVKRVYVPAPKLDAFFHVLCAAVNEFRVGHGLDERSTLAPMNNRRQFDYVRGLVERARAGGATVAELGTPLDPDHWHDGYYVLPTVVKDLAPDSELVVAEQFGPVIPVVGYGCEDEALRFANDSEYGLGSSIWARDTTHALELASRVEAGITFVNSHARTRLGELRMPFGGVKQSGIGRVRTEVGLAEYIEYHAISLDRTTCR